MDRPAKKRRDLSPPYLFAADGTPAPRPQIVNAPDFWRYGARVAIDYQGSGISKVHLIKIGAVTHSTNFGQKLIPLSIAASTSSRLQVNAPASAKLAVRKRPTVTVLP